MDGTLLPRQTKEMTAQSKEMILVAPRVRDVANFAARRA